MKLFLRVLSLILTLSAFYSVQSEELKETSEVYSVLETSMNEFKMGNWEGFSEYVHPEALDKFKNSVWSIMDYMATQDTTSESDMFLQMFGLNRVDGKLAEPSSKEFFNGFFNGISQLVPGFTDVMKSTNFDVLGNVIEGDTLVHVVTRSSAVMMNAEIVKMEVVTMKRYEGNWMMMLSSDLENFGAQFQQMMNR